MATQLTTRSQSVNSAVSVSELVPASSGTSYTDSATYTRPQWSFRPLTYREGRRRFWHMVPGLLPFALHAVSHADPISPTLRWIIVVCCALIGLKILTGFGRIQRLGEGSGAAAVSGYALSVLLTVLLFPGHLEIGVSVLSVLAFGDGSATLFGLICRGPRLPWNNAKSWSGLLAFLVVGSLMTAWIYCGETHNPEAVEAPVSFLTALLLVTPAVAAAGICESLQVRLNDNIRVGITAAVCLTAMHFFCRAF